MDSLDMFEKCKDFVEANGGGGEPLRKFILSLHNNKMDFEKLYDLSCSVSTWTEFTFEHTVAIKKISCSLSGDFMTEIEKSFLLRYYENEYYHFKQNMEDLIFKYKKLEKFLNENNIKGVK